VNLLESRSHLCDDIPAPQQRQGTKLTRDPSWRSFKRDRVAGENTEVSKWVDKYLGVGEWVMDQSVAIAGSSGWFERNR
jgi:hypothetical protein